jgi:hypothetical protein
MARISNWALNPKGFHFGELGAIRSGGLEKGAVFALIAKDTKRIEIHLSRDEAETLVDRLQRYLNFTQGKGIE